MGKQGSNVYEDKSAGISVSDISSDMTLSLAKYTARGDTHPN